MTVDFEKLKAPFPHECISWRVGATNKEKTSAIALAYIDARDVMERLDDVCGAENWMALHPHANGKTSCKIGIKINDEWVWKENGCGDSHVEAEKGAFSDALKRAAVLWGIGRYLYDVPNIWVEIDQYRKIKNPHDKRLYDALRQAENGIRAKPEEKTDCPFNGDSEVRKLWLVKAKEELDAMQTMDEYRAWEKDNLVRLNALGEKQREAVNGLMAKAVVRITNAPLEHGG